MKTTTEICRLGDDSYSLHVRGKGRRTAALFAERGLQGGGHTWYAIVQALLEMRMPEVLEEVELDSEADTLYVYCDSRGPLDSVAALVREALADERLLIAAMDRAGEELE